MRQTVTYDKTGDDGRFEPTFEREEFLDAVDDLELPTTADVAEAVGCAHRTALHHLNELEDDGALDSRLVGRAKVWSIGEGVTSASDRRESDPSPSPTETSEPIGGGHEPPSDDLAAVVDAIAEDWDDSADRLEARKAAARAVLEYAREHGTVSKKEAKENVRPKYPVEGQKPRTWYRKNIRPVLNEAAEYDQSARAYSLDLPVGEPDDEDEDTETDSSGVYDPTKEFE